ncbi:hypothetical protein [Sphaerimonospora mesophila]|uniref:hypothetical protein n=1 Tax=Sphaerimonospora mesophila TaxID=37483 RepID=UPI0006E39C5D
MSEVDNAKPGVFLVRAEVRDDLRDDFDHWYETDHLPLVIKTLGAKSGRRCWSVTSPGVHFAEYEFEDLDALVRIVGSPKLQPLLDEFDSRWPEGVVRTREILEPAGAAWATHSR